MVRFIQKYLPSNKEINVNKQIIITFSDIPITITKKSVKNINLRIGRQGEVSVSAPNRCSKASILKFLQQKEAWIKANVEAMKKRQESIQPNNMSFYWFLGRYYPIRIQEHHQAQVILEENHIACFVKPATSEKTTQRLLVNWHRERMKMLLPDLIAKWEAIIGVTVLDWTIKTMVSRWGSCHTRKKRICLNLSLIQKPLVCLEYVLVHEMVHLLEESHNHRFHALMTRFMPEWRTYEYMLKEL